MFNSSVHGLDYRLFKTLKFFGQSEVGGNHALSEDFQPIGLRCSWIRLGLSYSLLIHSSLLLILIKEQVSTLDRSLLTHSRFQSKNR
ncbi:hypothetical protein L6452_37262 [Arctium lappa]|uniref:Uncharacterized protein n=1 Tax=Arctium lappa TaxID=4217 RepID=A0ACB8Y363_ARCLA|nr:hypothetical protein L6452_37262 [Arctium lappa]